MKKLQNIVVLILPHLFCKIATVIAAKCPPAWKESAHYCYLRAPNNDQWNGIQNFCGTVGGRLPVLASEDELKDFASSVVDWSTSNNVWIGAFLNDPSGFSDRNFRYATDCGDYGHGPLNNSLAVTFSAWETGFPINDRGANRLFLASGSRKMRNTPQHNNLFSGYCQRQHNKGGCKGRTMTWDKTYETCHDPATSITGTSELDSRFCDLDNRKDYALDTCNKCGGTYSGTSGVICSPNHPSYYPNLQNCVYTIRVPEGSVVNLEMVHLDIELNTDYVTVFDGPLNSRQLVSLSGYSLPINAVFRSTGNLMTVVMTTDIYDYFTGFKAFYSTGNCPNIFQNSRGNVSSLSPYLPSGPAVTYSCPVGSFYPSTNFDHMTFTCLPSGRWNNQFEECTATCDLAIVMLANGLVTQFNISNILKRVVAGSTVSFSCNDGFQLKGATNSTCEPDGLWSRLAPVCSPVETLKCYNQFQKAQGKLNVSAAAGFSKLTGPILYTCPERHFYPDTNSTSRVFVCDENGFWDTKFFECTATCEPSHAELPYGVVTNLRTNNVLRRVAAGTIVWFTCNNGYILRGAIRSQCLSNETWSDETPFCEEIPVSTTETVLGKRSCADVESLWPLAPVNRPGFNFNFASGIHQEIKQFLDSVKLSFKNGSASADNACLCDSAVETESETNSVMTSAIEILLEILDTAMFVQQKNGAKVDAWAGAQQLYKTKPASEKTDIKHMQ